MSILGIEYKNIRKISSLKLSFERTDGRLYDTSFIMMGNGTGKTTTMTLIKGLLDGTATNWSGATIKSFMPIGYKASSGMFSLSVKFDERKYIYFLKFDYVLGKATITTSALPRGEEPGLNLPESIRSLFTTEFVKRFVFDGEQATKSMDSTSNEAEETIRYLYRLDELDSVLALNDRLLREKQDNSGKSGSEQSLKNLRTRQQTVQNRIEYLTSKAEKIRIDTEKNKKRKRDLENQLEQLDKKFKQLNNDKNKLINQIDATRRDIETKIREILNKIKLPYLLTEGLANTMSEFGGNMKKLKLPKTSSKDFFIELANAPVCICDRIIGEKEKDAILRKANGYLGSDLQSVLNQIKSCLIGCNYSEDVKDLFAELNTLTQTVTRLEGRLREIRDKLTAAGGDKSRELKDQIDELSTTISKSEVEKERILSRDESDPTLTEENNIHQARLVEQKYNRDIASATSTKKAVSQHNIVENLILQIKNDATVALKKEIIRKTNQKLAKAITDDIIQVENIDGYIKLVEKNAASEGQTLSIAYCFLGTLFEDSELLFPFVIDSPAGKMDFEKRRAIADIIPSLFEQLVAFVTSAEVEQFADQFYNKDNAQFVTIIANPTTEAVEIYNGVSFFAAYQKEHADSEE